MCLAVKDAIIKESYIFSYIVTSSAPEHRHYPIRTSLERFEPNSIIKIQVFRRFSLHRIPRLKERRFIICGDSESRIYEMTLESGISAYIDSLYDTLSDIVTIINNSDNEEDLKLLISTIFI